MNTGVENVDVNGGYCYINISTLSESETQNSIDGTKKRNEISPNIPVMENNGFTGWCWY